MNYTSFVFIHGANQAARRATLQNNDLTGVTTLVPPINLPEIPHILKVKLLKLRVRAFKMIIRGWFQKEGLLFLPGTLQWKLVNSLYVTTHLGEKALQRSLERSFRGTGLHMTI